MMIQESFKTGKIYKDVETGRKYEAVKIGKNTWGLVYILKSLIEGEEFSISGKRLERGKITENYISCRKRIQRERDELKKHFSSTIKAIRFTGYNDYGIREWRVYTAEKEKWSRDYRKCELLKLKATDLSCNVRPELCGHYNVNKDKSYTRSLINERKLRNPWFLPLGKSLADAIYKSGYKVKGFVYEIEKIEHPLYKDKHSLYIGKREFGSHRTDIFKFNQTTEYWGGGKVPRRAWSKESRINPELFKRKILHMLYCDTDGSIFYFDEKGKKIKTTAASLEREYISTQDPNEGGRVLVNSRKMGNPNYDEYGNPIWAQ